MSGSVSELKGKFQTQFGQWILQRPNLGSGLYTTVWKFHDFSVTQILREINLEDSRSAKFAILTHLEALNFDVL